MLRTSVGYMHLSEDSHTSSTLCFVAKEEFLPWSILHKLFAYCLAFWPVAEKNDSRILYADYAVFEVDNFHSLTIEKKNHAIRIRISHFLGREKISKRLCTGLRITFKDYLERITNVWESKDDNYEAFYFALQCRQNDSLQGLADVSSLCHKEEHQYTNDGNKDNIGVTHPQKTTYFCEIHRSVHEVDEVKQYWYFSEVHFNVFQNH